MFQVGGTRGLFSNPAVGTIVLPPLYIAIARYIALPCRYPIDVCLVLSDGT